MLIVLLLAVGQTRSESFGGKASVSQVLIVTKWLRLVGVIGGFHKRPETALSEASCCICQTWPR